ncbi:HTH domain-containing protein [Lentilactobacillus otakiensis]|uniref:RepB protein n=1 Tax=Lentilactobacillus otakiensis DSM 19908 = JCM 15040 TaxID=1423780 RepID=S4NTE8_9LACO|nr:HTH domain-containing protein [Lentilactobacillus otakiensis]MDV3517739.1 HTH domain-containing protein [Lentilactobacillus otakiensis]GAD17248.1 repB protein [Lentilactobacillus otakiensis DSM 19908 = JCM 15040]
MELTIKELADELSVSKTAIRKHMDDKFRDTYTIKKGNKILIKDEGVEVLKGQFKNQNEHTESEQPKQTANQLSVKGGDKQTALLAEQLEDQRKQIDAKDKQIAELHQLLDQSQRLQLDVQNKLKQLESQGTSSVKQTIPESVNEEDHSEDKIPDSYQPSNARFQEAGKKKHWWQFGR